jgi:DNA polymerase-3 subunit delta'
MTTETLPEPDRVEGAPHPRHTSELFGQSAAEAEFLDSFNSDRMHHAWLIAGPQGVGKATLAWRIAKFLLAQPADKGGMFGGQAPARPDSLQIEPDHPVARRVGALSEPRLFLCRRPWDEKGKRLRQNITVEETRKLKSFFTLSATDGGYRVAIVDAADEMNTAAANALLKILEEPPEKTVLLLVSHHGRYGGCTVEGRVRRGRSGSGARHPVRRIGRRGCPAAVG